MPIIAAITLQILTIHPRNRLCSHGQLATEYISLGRTLTRFKVLPAKLKLPQPTSDDTRTSRGGPHNWQIARTTFEEPVVAGPPSRRRVSVRRCR